MTNNVALIVIDNSNLNVYMLHIWTPKLRSQLGHCGQFHRHAQDVQDITTFYNT